MRFWIILGMVVGMAHVAFGDEVPSVEALGDKPAMVNEPTSAAKQATDVIDVLEPTLEAVWNIEAEEWAMGTSLSVYDFQSHNIFLGRVKTGYLSSNAFYGGIDVDLPGIVDRYMHGGWPHVEKVFSAVAEYARVGYIVGYDLEADNLVHGPSFGASWRF